MKRRAWDLREFSQINLPEVVTQALHPKIFENRGVRVLDMPIRLPGGIVTLPPHLYQFAPIVGAALQQEWLYDDYSDLYVYITIDQRGVLQGDTHRRPGAHADAYIEIDDTQQDVTAETVRSLGKSDAPNVVENTYLAYDSIPTEFFSVPFPLTSGDDKTAMETFDALAEVAARTGHVVRYPPYTLLKMSAYTVHRCGVATGPGITNRTFVKVSFSHRRFTRRGNTVNPDLKVDWQPTERQPTRNTPWA